MHEVPLGCESQVATFAQRLEWIPTGGIPSDRQRAACDGFPMFVERLTAVLPGVLREDVSQAQTKAAVTAIHVPEVLTVRDFHAVLHPHNVQWRRSCARAQNVRFVVTRTGMLLILIIFYFILFDSQLVAAVLDLHQLLKPVWQHVKASYRCHVCRSIFGW